MDEYNAVVEKYNRLCEERNNNLFWAENITDATDGLVTPIVWQNFYAYMANEQHKYTDKWQESIGEQVEQGLTLKVGSQQFKTKTVHNGPVTYIKMTPENLHVSNKTQDGKQMACISEGIQEEKSDS